MENASLCIELRFQYVIIYISLENKNFPIKHIFLNITFTRFEAIIHQIPYRTSNVIEIKLLALIKV